jgi:hypothetical protein
MMTERELGAVEEAIHRIDANVEEVRKTLAELPCQTHGERLATLETRAKWHERIGGGVGAVILGLLGVKL